MRTILLKIAVLFLWQAVSLAAEVSTVSDGWALSINSNSLNPAGTAGADFKDNFESLADETVLEVVAAGAWHITLARDGWSPGGSFVLEAGQSGSYTVIPQEAPPGGTTFFSGTGNTTINCQYQLSNVHAAEVNTAAYSTTVTFTVIDD